MELALCLEKLTNEKLLKLHSAADRNNDVQLADFVESEFLTEQVDAIKKISEYVAQLRRVEKGHGVWDFNQMLLREEAKSVPNPASIIKLVRGFVLVNPLFHCSLLVQFRM